MNLGAGTLGTWVNTVGGEKIVPLINLMGEELFDEAFMHIDETPLQVLRSNKAVGSDHYIVVRAGGSPGRRLVLYDYIASRTTAALKQLFVGPDGPYRGKFISDGLERYDDIAAELKLLHFGCLQHCRTMFFKAHKVSQSPSTRTLANAAMVEYIRPVYQVEDRIKALRKEYAARSEILPLDTVLALRQEKSKPILEKFKTWVDELLPGTPPNSALGKALGYTHRHYAERQTMPNGFSPSTGPSVIRRVQRQNTLRATRHSLYRYNAAKNCSSWSPALNRPALVLSGSVFANAVSLSPRCACI